MNTERARRWISTVIAIVFLASQCVMVMPGTANADAAADLKNIEYKHYFRGDYEKTITELRAFLAREDMNDAQIVEAKEYLAASLIMTGRSEEGKVQYTDLLKLDGAYGGPDPSVFKSVIIATYEEARADYASAVIHSVPETVTTPVASPGEPDVGIVGGKPFYKKWWFYATMGAVALVIAGAASGSSDGGDSTPTPRGTVTVGVDVP